MTQGEEEVIVSIYCAAKDLSKSVGISMEKAIEQITKEFTDLVFNKQRDNFMVHGSGARGGKRWRDLVFSFEEDYKEHKNRSKEKEDQNGVQKSGE